MLRPVLAKKWIVPLFFLLAAIGLVLLVVGIMYVAVHASDLPSWFPGHVATRYNKKGKALPTNARTKRGYLAIVLAAVSFIGAWWVLFRYKPTSDKELRPS
jgi:hypothetical protein